MSKLKAQLLAGLRALDIEPRPSPVAGGVALFLRNKPFGHFHGDHEIDLRLGRRFIQTQGLSPLPDSTFHPRRAAGSPWLERRFHSPRDVEELLRLIALALADR